MLLYKISRYEGGPAIYRRNDEYLLDVVEDFMEVQERGNTLYIEVVELDEWQDDRNY